MSTDQRRFEELWIGGRAEQAGAGVYPITNPADESVAGWAPVSSPAQVESAVRAAREAFDQGPWPRLGGIERGRLLARAAAEFRRRAPELVNLTIDETGALAQIAERLQVGQVADRLDVYAQLAAEPDIEGLPPLAREPVAGSAATLAAGIVVREPVGVVACLSPYNFPMTNCAGKIAPALACGNTVVIKPPPQDPLGVCALARIVGEVLPPGVVNFVSGPGPELGEALVSHAGIDMISFTGSTAVGERIQSVAARGMKRTLMELGGKSAAIVFADADLDGALRSAMSVFTFHSGQICIAPTRLLVERSIYDAFTARLATAASRLPVGEPRTPGVVVGPVISRAQQERIAAWVERAVEEGARVACGGRRPEKPDKGFYFEPTLLTQATNAMAVAREEIFGPVVTAIPFADEDDAVAIANDSDYGLYGYVWSGDSLRAMRVARRMRTGTVQINGSPPNPDAPFGGFKRSGIGRDGGRFALAAYSELKAIGWAAR